MSTFIEKLEAELDHKVVDNNMKYIGKDIYNKYIALDFVNEIIARYGDNFVQVLDHA